MTKSNARVVIDAAAAELRSAYTLVADPQCDDATAMPHLRRAWQAVDDEPIGTCGFHLWSRAYRRAEVGYEIAPGSWGRGLMTEALGAVLRHGFDRLLLHRVVACVHPDNAASLRLAEARRSLQVHQRLGELEGRVGDVDDRDAGSRDLPISRQR